MSLTGDDVDVRHVLRAEVDDGRALLEGHPQHVLLRLRAAQPVDPDDVHPPPLDLVDAPLEDDRHRVPARLALQHGLEVAAEELVPHAEVARALVGLAEVGEAEGEVKRAGGVEPEGDLLEGLALAEEGGEAEGGTVAEAVAELGVPAVDEELHLQVVGQVQVEPVRVEKELNSLLVNS